MFGLIRCNMPASGSPKLGDESQMLCVCAAQQLLHIASDALVGNLALGVWSALCRALFAACKSPGPGRESRQVGSGVAGGGLGGFAAP